MPEQQELVTLQLTLHIKVFATIIWIVVNKCVYIIFYAKNESDKRRPHWQRCGEEIYGSSKVLLYLKVASDVREILINGSKDTKLSLSLRCIKLRENLLLISVYIHFQ